jgi:hypothetical protein
MRTAGHVYVVAFDNGIVKVGRTQNLTNRLRSHKGDGRRFGITLTDSWASPLHVEWLMNEETLKTIAVKHGGTPTCAEYFTGADYALVAGAAARLPFTPPREIASRRPLKCPKGHENARMCAIRVGALDAGARETAGAVEGKGWNNYRPLVTCGRCA